LRIITILLYFIFGLIISPILGLAIFLLTLPDFWKRLKGAKKKQGSNPFDIKLTEDDILGTPRPDEPERIGMTPIYYPRKGVVWWD